MKTHHVWITLVIGLVAFILITNEPPHRLDWRCAVGIAYLKAGPYGGEVLTPMLKPDGLPMTCLEYNRH